MHVSWFLDVDVDMLRGRPRGGVSLKKKKKQQQPAWEPPGPRIDPFTVLPVDMIQQVSNYMSVRQVLRWRRVCKRWKEAVHNPAMSAFWRRASMRAGLPEYCVQKLLPQCSAVDELFRQARSFTDHVARIRPETKRLNGIHPFESTRKCVYAGEGYFVKTVDRQSLEKEETAIGEMCPYSRTIQRVASVTGQYGDVVKATVMANHIVWHTSEGYWFRYHLVEETASRLFDTLIKSENLDSVGYCRHCLFVVIICSESPTHNYNWKMRFFKVEGDKVIESVHTAPIPSKVAQYIPRPVEALIISTDGCKTHRFIAQGGTGACVFDLTHDFQEKKIEMSSKPVTILDPFYDCQIPVMVVSSTSSLVLSPDERFAALLTSIIYPYASGLCLHFFDMKTYKRTLSVRLNWEDTFNDCGLIAISELYAVVGIGHGHGHVKIVHCRSGNVVSSIGPIAKGLPPVPPMSRNTYVSMLGAYGEEHLVDIRGKLNMVVLYRRGEGNVEAVYYDPFPPSFALLEDSSRFDSDTDNDQE